MVFDSTNSPNLISNNYHVSSDKKLFTISEKIIMVLKNLFSEYIYPNYMIIIGVSIIIGFLMYRYKKQSEGKKNIYNRTKSHRPHNF